MIENVKCLFRSATTLKFFNFNFFAHYYFIFVLKEKPNQKEVYFVRIKTVWPMSGISET